MTSWSITDEIILGICEKKNATLCHPVVCVGFCIHYTIRHAIGIPVSKVHGANMGSMWGLQNPGGPHGGPANFAIWDAFRIIGFAGNKLPVIRSFVFFFANLFVWSNSNAWTKVDWPVICDVITLMWCNELWLHNIAWASCQIRKIAVCACARNAGNTRDARVVMHAWITN